MRVGTLAGTRRRIDGPAGLGPLTRAALAPSTPQYRWTFKTWIKREWRDWNNIRCEDTLQERTVTVIAPAEVDAKGKILAALPPAPDIRDTYNYRNEHHERRWSIEGAVEEVE